MLATICNPECHNGGTCARNLDNQTQCYCPGGYSGDQCDKGTVFSCFMQQTTTIFFRSKSNQTYINRYNFKIYYILGPVYSPQVTGKACYNRYNHFNNLTEAKAACNLDYGCQALEVDDSDCNEISDDIYEVIYLCPMGTTYSISESSCIYEKGKIWCCVAKVEDKILT